MDSWRVLFPWCRWLRGRLQLQETHESAGYWLLVTLPKHQRNASSDLLPKVREALSLLALVAAVDKDAFGDILCTKCGVDHSVSISNMSNISNKLRVTFVLDDHTSRSLMWPETICKALLAWEESTLSEDFLLAKEEMETIAEKKLGIVLPKVDIPFCLHFAPRDINSVGLQQYLQSVQRVLHAVMPRRGDLENATDFDDDENGTEIWPFVFEAVQLNLQEFELNESVAKALKELVLVGAKVSCLHLPLKATDFLSEDECPRQPLADCLLAITGGGPRSQLFSSTFGPEPQDNDGESVPPRGTVETLVINDADIDDRRFAALCSALRGSSGVNELVLESVFVQDAQRARAVKWKWLTYALFTPNSEKSSVTKLTITEPQLLADDIAAISSVVNAQKPAQELLDPLWAEHETHQRSMLSEEKEENPANNQQDASGSTTVVDDLIRLHKDTVVYLEPLCSQDEWLQASVVLEQDADFAIMSVNYPEIDDTNKRKGEEDWVEILVPGYGKCWVHPEVAYERYTPDLHLDGWAGITELSLTSQVAKSSTDKIFTQLFQLIGHDLVSLSLHTNVLRERGLGSILRSCPSLKKLELNGAQIGDMFAFTHGYDVGYCQVESLSIEHFRVSAASLGEFAKVLSDPDREAARHLHKLTIGKLRIYDVDSALADYENMIKRFSLMLSTNTTLQFFKLYIEGDFYTRFLKNFIMHNGEQLLVKLSAACKAALLSVLRSDGSQRLGAHLIRRIFRYAAKRVCREVCIVKY